jgi:predicted transcriptional regulator of viral defense system
MPAKGFISQMMAEGHYCFSSREAESALGVGAVAARAALRRLRHKGDLAVPHKGFYVIVPPEYKAAGCLPASHFIPDLMQRLETSYYAGLLSAAEYHGAAHQRPQVFQVMTAKNRPGIACGKVRVEFVARKNVSDIPKTDFKTPRGYLKVSTPAATAFDLVGYPRHAAGFDNVATVLAELAEKINPQELVSVAALSPVAWAQRLGYLLDLVGAGNKTQALAEYVAGKKPIVTFLSSSHPLRDVNRSKRWRLVANVRVETDL